MLKQMEELIRGEKMLPPGSRVLCAVSGGADSVCLLAALYCLREKLGVELSAAHYNHNLRGEESRRDEAFVRELVENRFPGVALYVGGGDVAKAARERGAGLEETARALRYAFLEETATAAGCDKIATAHTADDNAETVLLHLLRGTGLKGLGGIAPKNGRIIRPMLRCTRQDVEAFLTEYCLQSRFDSSNAGDDFLRNRLRHHVMPLLKQENPGLAENTSAMALRLRQDESCLSSLAELPEMDVETLRTMHPALRKRALESFLKHSGVREPEASHITQAESLVFSPKPSAFARFPGGVTIGRNYGLLQVQSRAEALEPVELPVPGSILWGDYRITAAEAGEGITVHPDGPITVRSRLTGDSIRLSGGSKTLKKLFIDRKIPASERDRIPVLADRRGILAVHGFGIHSDTAVGKLPAVRILIEKITNTEEKENA